MRRPYTQQRPKQHNNHVWTWIAHKRKQRGAVVEFPTVAVRIPPALTREREFELAMRERRDNERFTKRTRSGGRDLGRFGKW